MNAPDMIAPDDLYVRDRFICCPISDHAEMAANVGNRVRAHIMLRRLQAHVSMHDMPRANYGFLMALYDVMDDADLSTLSQEAA